VTTTVVNPHQVLQVLDTTQAAVAAGRHRDTIKRALESGDLHGSQRCKGGRWWIRAECFNAWLSGGRCVHQIAEAAS